MGTTTPNIGLYIPADGETNYGTAFANGMLNLDTHDHSGPPNKGVPLSSAGLANGSVTALKLNADVLSPGGGLSFDVNNAIQTAGVLKAIFGIGSNGFVSRTSGTTASPRTITGTANQIAVANGDGVSGNPTLSLPANVVNSGQSAFNAFMSVSSANVTGDGTLAGVIFDGLALNQGANYNPATGVFTAPVTGRYLFTCTISVTNLAAGHTSGIVDLVTTAATFQGGFINPFACQETAFNICTLPPFSIIVPLTVGQTAFVAVKVSGGTKTVAVFGAGGSSFSAMLLPA